MTGGGLDVPIPLVGSSVGQLIGAGASGGGGVTYAQHAAAGDVPATTSLTDASADFGPDFLGRQIVVGSTTATIVDAQDHTLTLAPQFGSVPADETPYLVENELLGAVHVLQALTPATLQETIAMAQTSLGHDSTIDFGLVDGDAGAQLRLDLTWNREYAVSRPVSIDLGEGQEVVGAEASGELKLDASGIIKLRLLLPLTAAAMLEPVDNTRVDEGFSEVAFNVAVAAEDAHIGASVGPVSLFLGTEDEPGSLHAGFGIRATGTTGEDTPSIADFFSSGFDIGMTNGGADCEEDAQILCATFPTFVAGSSAGDLTVTSTLGDGDDLTDVFTGTSTVIGIPDSLKGLIEGKPFEFDTLAEGLKQYLFYAETVAACGVEQR